MRRENNFQESNFYDTFKRRDRGRLHWWIFVLVFRDLHALQTTSDIVIRVKHEGCENQKWRWCRHTPSSIFRIFQVLLCGAGLLFCCKEVSYIHIF